MRAGLTTSAPIVFILYFSFVISAFRDGKTTTVHLKGAIDCRNPLCPRKLAGLSSMGRDSNAASNIGISGAFILLSANHSTLPLC
jgi:hypothetical protein